MTSRNPAPAPQSAPISKQPASSSETSARSAAGETGGKRPAFEASGFAQRLIAALAYLGPFVIVPILARNKKRFVYYHTRQGLYVFVLFASLFILTVALLFAFWQNALDVRPVFTVLSVLFFLEVFVYAGTVLVLILMTLMGRMPMLPLLGDLAGER